MPTFHPFPSPQDLVSTLTQKISSALSAALAARNQASLVVSGGSTPKPLFAELSKQELEWAKVTISLADERWVAPDDPASNEGLVRNYLMQNKAAAANFIGLWTGDATASSGETACSAALAKIPRPFDLMILGMGGDGHTCSFFPGAEALPQALDMKSAQSCQAITPLTAPHERMTLTLPTVLNSRQIILHIEGEEKKEVYETALEEGPVGEMPVRAVLRQDLVGVDCYWAPTAQ